VVTGKSNLLYRGSRDGISYAAMSARTLNKGPTLMIVTTTKGVSFGGFTKPGFNGNNGWTTDAGAFLFHVDY